MYRVIVKAFGGIEQLQVVEMPTIAPALDSTQVLVRLTSIGINQADLMARRGEYKLVSGSPPFTPGREGGGYIEAIGDRVSNRQVGQRVILSLGALAYRYNNSDEYGTYRSHYLTTADKTIPVPDAIPDELLGALWMPYLTAWGCLIWKQELQPGQFVLLPAASSSVAIAASQIIKHYGGITIGITTSQNKAERLRVMAEAQYDLLVVTSKKNWWQEIKEFTDGKGVDVSFDPVAAGEFLSCEIRLLKSKGTLWIYGLLGKFDKVDVTPLIRKSASIRGWLLGELVGADHEYVAYQHVLERVVNRTYSLPIYAKFSLYDVRAAHEAMEKKQHIGKMLLVP